jgi:D-alanyl-lipoteichoic acid acyltransferase DltB (MBOAT superfamily)
LVAFGLFKKVLVADRLGLVVDEVHRHLHGADSGAILVAVYAYPIQLYADFSGLTDIAIGMGRMVGIEGPPNFDSPFYAPNIQAFWRRWHMSLTNWLGDYVFAPLRMSLRKLGKIGLALSVCINMVAVGLWHKGTWNFVLFGVVNGVFLTVSLLTLRARDRFFLERPSLSSVRRVVGPLVTFHLIVLALVFARSESLPDAMYIFHHLVPARLRDAVAECRHAGVVTLSAIPVMEAVHLARRSGRLSPILDSLPTWIRWGAYYAAAIGIILGILQQGEDAPGAFIYGQF